MGWERLGPNQHTISQINDALRDGLRSVKNAIEDAALVPGAGAYEVACAHHLSTVTKASAASPHDLPILI